MFGGSRQSLSWAGGDLWWPGISAKKEEVFSGGDAPFSWT